MKDKIIGIIFIAIICGFFLINIIKKDEEISLEQRRKLAQFPIFKIDNILNTTFAKGLDKYVVDQFTFNNMFRKIKAQIAYNVLNQKENNDIFVKDNSLYKLEYPLNQKSLDNFNDVVSNLTKNLNKKNISNIYISIVPDKNYYLTENIPKLEYNKIFTKIKENANKNKIKYIDITNNLDLKSYYRTDTHWKQEKLDNVVETLMLNITNNKKYIKGNYEKKEYENFRGVYLGQSAINIPPDKLTYLTNSKIENSIVTSIEDKEKLSVYDESKLGKMDSYDVFLSGAKAFLTIENKEKVKEEKELIIFRDSFGSSISPLLIEKYSKIILIDLRYISMDKALENIQKKDNQDVLILYSTLIVNNSFTLKK